MPTCTKIYLSHHLKTESTFSPQERDVKLSVENATQGCWEKIMELEKAKMELEEQLSETKR